MFDRAAPASSHLGGGVDVLIVHPDHERRIDLPGTGPCFRPVDIDRSRTGFSSLVSLRVYSFSEGMVIDGEAEADEVFVILMRGHADITVSRAGHPAIAFPLVRGSGTRAVFMPPHSCYCLAAVTDCEIAYARAEPRGSNGYKPQGFAPDPGGLRITARATGMDFALATVRAGQAIGTAGNGSPERFVHVRSAGAMSATIGGEPLTDWDTAALADGESVFVELQSGAAEILTVSACPLARHDTGAPANKTRQ